MFRKVVFILATLGCVVFMVDFLLLGNFDRAVEFLALYSLLILQDWNK